ncbi:MAG: nucleotidyltransferase domain-containing protein [Acidobacteriota bacterium]
MANRIDEKALDRLVEELRAAHGDNLASIVLYGSVAAGDQIEPRSDFNLLIALQRIGSDDLRASQDALREWQRLGQPLPVYFTVEELSRAADVFPIEFLQMEKARKVLFGRDPFELVEISKANLRHQTEYELRTKLIQLRRLYIPASTSVAKLSALMADSLASFAALFRAVLIMHGQEPPVGKADSVRATARLLDLDGTPFERILELRAEFGSKLTEDEANRMFSSYLAQIERVIKAVDLSEQ